MLGVPSRPDITAGNQVLELVHPTSTCQDAPGARLRRRGPATRDFSCLGIHRYCIVLAVSSPLTPLGGARTMGCLRRKLSQLSDPPKRFIGVTFPDDRDQNHTVAGAKARGGRPPGRTNRRFIHKGWSAMNALIAFPVRRLGFYVLVTASISCMLTIASPIWSIAKTRPPVEMGDPDATGDQATVPGPSTSIATTKPIGTLVPSSGVRMPRRVGLSLVGLTVRSYLSFWSRGVL